MDDEEEFSALLKLVRAIDDVWSLAKAGKADADKPLTTQELMQRFKK